MANKNKEESTSKKTSNFWLGAALGTLAGTITGILIAPKSGEETRADIKEAGKKTSKKLSDKLHDFVHRNDPKEQKRITAGKILVEKNPQIEEDTEDDTASASMTDEPKDNTNNDEE